MQPAEFRTAEERSVTLTAKERETILAIDPTYLAVAGAAYFDNYDLPCPVRVDVSRKDGKMESVVLKAARHGDVRTEVRVMRALEEFGLPVPAVLAEPFLTEDGKYAAVYSLLPGENLQKLSMRSEKDLAAAKDLVLRAVSELTAATEFVRNHEVSKILPTITLTDELESLETNGNPWLDDVVYRDALRALEKVIPRIETPLVFSSGDFQPGNFLAERDEIAGFLDFETASFHDPLMGFVKYPIYDLYPLARTDLVRTFLAERGFSERDFDHRLALGCLKTLKREIPISRGDRNTQEYRSRVLAMLNGALRLSTPAD
jgi:aminoglycoside/choline kinase family phosphotransferase